MLKKLSKLEGEKRLLPDVECFAKNLLLACLARGRSEIYPVPATGIYARLCGTMRDLGYDLHMDGEALVVQGPGMQFVPHIENLQGLSGWAGLDLLLLVLLSHHFEQASISCERPNMAHLRLCLPWLKLDYADQQLSWSVIERHFPIHHNFEKSQPDARDALVLRALLAGEPLQIQESHSSRDHWMNSLLHAGAVVEHERTGLNLEDLDEVERRMLRKKGVKTDRKSIWRWSPTQVLRPVKVKLPGDLSLASALAFVATLLPGSNIEIKDVCATASRIGFVASLKKMGAQVEWLARKEKQGEATANLRVKYSRQLQGRKLSGDQIQCQGLEFALLTALSVLIPEETILRDLPDWIENSADWQEKCALALRQTGAEMGIYEDGLVFQGREQLDGGDWDLNHDLALNLGLQLLALRLHGKSNFSNALDLNEIWPDFWSWFDGGADATDK